MLKLLLVLAALAGLLIPRAGVMPEQLLIAAPLAVAAVWHRGDRRFLLWSLYALGYVIFVTTRGYAHTLGFPVQWEYAAVIDRAIGLGELPTIRLQRWLYTPGRAGLLEYFSVVVYGSFFFLQTALAAVLWFAGAKHWPRYVVATVVTWAASIAVIILLPTVPPWMASGDGHIPHVFRVVKDLIAGAAPGAYDYGLGIAGQNPVAAMPSLHFAGALLVSYGLWHWHWTLRLPAAIYAAWMAFALVYFGEHYVADVLVGAVIVAVAWRLARRVSH